MKATRLALFVLGLLCFGAQVVRHIYVRWFEPTHSVLEKYEAHVRGDIRNSRSLAELESRYAVELKKSGGHPPGPAAAISDETAPGTARSAVAQLREAIEEWETHEKEIREMRFFYFTGFIALLVAWLISRRFPWAALSLTILGFSDILWATSPSWRSGPAAEFQRLLENKVVFSLLAIAFLLLFRWRGPLETAPTGQRSAA
jgi:hypothetical protein